MLGEKMFDLINGVDNINNLEKGVIFKDSVGDIYIVGALNPFTESKKHFMSLESFNIYDEEAIELPIFVLADKNNYVIDLI